MEIIEIDNKLYRQEEMTVEDIEREILVEEGKIEESQATIEKYRQFLPKEDEENTEENLDTNENPTY